MAKRFKGLKRFGMLLLSIAMFFSSVVIIIPANIVYAAGTYEKKTSDADIKVAEWRFADGLEKYNENFEIVSSEVVKDPSDPENKAFGKKYHLRLENAYKWSGSEKIYDIHFNIYLYYQNNGFNNTFLTTSPEDLDELKAKRDTKGNETIDGVYIPSATHNYISISAKNGSVYTLEVEMWLEYDPDDSGSEPSVPVPFEGEDGVPVILGAVWSGDSEVNEIYSSEDVFTNYLASKMTFGNARDNPNSTVQQGYVTNDNNYNKLYRYITGFGHENNKIKLVYTQAKDGTLEMRIGYRSYTIEYFANDPSTIVADSLPKLETIPVSDETEPGNPKDKAGEVTAEAGNKITKFIVKDVFYGEKYNNIPIEKFVELTDGTKIDVNGVIKPWQIPMIKMNKNVEIEVYTVSAANAVQLNYHLGNDKIPLLSGHTTGEINLVENYEKDVEHTSNGSYVPGTVVTGSDGKKYKLVGWYTDNTYTTEFGFGGTLSNPITDIFAKWELVDTSTPTPTPDGSDSSTPPATDEPIKVEFVTPIGNPPPTQIKHVGDKVDDPGAPVDPATMKPGTIINGHRFEGWYLDKGFTMPYNFDTKLPHSIVLYAKWVRVSPKTGDTTIPPVYFVFGALALAGAGAVVVKSRKLRK